MRKNFTSKKKWLHHEKSADDLFFSLFLKRKLKTFTNSSANAYRMWMNNMRSNGLLFVSEIRRTTDVLQSSTKHSQNEIGWQQRMNVFFFSVLLFFFSTLFDCVAGTSRNHDLWCGARNECVRSLYSWLGNTMIVRWNCQADDGFNSSCNE